MSIMKLLLILKILHVLNIRSSHTSPGLRVLRVTQDFSIQRSFLGTTSLDTHPAVFQAHFRVTMRLSTRARVCVCIYIYIKKKYV